MGVCSCLLIWSGLGLVDLVVVEFGANAADDEQVTVCFLYLVFPGLVLVSRLEEEGIGSSERDL